MPGSSNAWKGNVMDSDNARLVAYLPGRGVGTMQVVGARGYVYIGELAPGGGTQIVDVRDPRHPRHAGYLEGYPGSYSPKVQIGEDRLLVNYEARNGEAAFVGLGVWDISTPDRPARLGQLSTGGKGVHRMWYTGGRYAYASLIPEGLARRIFAIIDLDDPASPVEVARWRPELSEPEGLNYGLHHPIVANDIAFMGWWDYGVLVADVSNVRQPRQIGSVSGWAAQGGGHTHTALPLVERKLLVVTDEAGDLAGEETRKFIRIFDIQDVTAPKLLATCPAPEGDFGRNGVRFGPHNLHENRPGSFISERLVFATYFGAGLRVYDVSTPEKPAEVAHFVPDPAPEGYVPINDLFVDASGLIYLTDRRAGDLYIVELT